MYKRKTEDEYQVHQHTTAGWEEVTAEKTWREAKERAREYRENQPEYAVKIVKKRIKIVLFTRSDGGKEENHANYTKPRRPAASEELPAKS